MTARFYTFHDGCDLCPYRVKVGAIKIATREAKEHLAELVAEHKATEHCDASAQ